MKTLMTKASRTLRIVYAICLVGATCVHVAFHLRFGVFLEALAGSGYSLGTRIFWSSLTLLDPIAALLLFFHPCAGLALACIIIVCDVVHNSWILHHFGMAPDAAYWAQVTFLIFLLATIRSAWRGSPRGPVLKSKASPEQAPGHLTRPPKT